MSDSVTGDATHPQPTPIDLTTVDPTHPDHESADHLLGTAVAETALAVTGVHHLGGVAARTLDRAARAVLGSSTTPGVTVSRDAGTATVDLDLVVSYPHPVGDVADSVRRQVKHAAAQLVGDRVVVNVNVTDVHGPFDAVAEAAAAPASPVESAVSAGS